MNVALILAGGTGERMETALPKQFLPVGGRPMILRTLDAFEAHPEIGAIWIVCASGWSGRLKNLLEAEGCRKCAGVVNGGRDRRESSRLGLAALRAAAAPDDVVLIHDAARPLVSAQTISDCIACARETGACAAAVPVTDTIYQSADGGSIASIPDRRTLWAAQTPQAFRLSLIWEGHERCPADASISDDAGLLVSLDVPVRLVPGAPENIKITSKADLSLAELLGRDGRKEESL